jgi:signal transduction histidine kinase
MKFRVKIMLSMLCILSLLFSIGGGLLISLSFQVTLKREKDTAFVAYQSILNTLSYVDRIRSWTDSTSVSDILEQLHANNTSAEAAIQLSYENTTVYETGAIARFLELPTREIAPQTCATSILQVEGKQYLQLVGILQLADKQMYLTTAYDITSVYEMRSEQLSIYYKVFAVTAILCAILAYAISGLLTRPLSKLARASREIAKGNLSYRSKVHTNDELGSLSVSFDTMAQQVEENIHELQIAMERQERFMGSFAHEMKNPMTSILGYADLIRGQTLSLEEQSYAASYIYSEGKRLESLSLKLLDIFLSDKQSVVLSIASPGAIIKEIVTSLRPAYAEKGIDLGAKCENGSCFLEPDLIKSLIINLLDNARKAIDGSGTIFITAKITVDGCQIVVTDSGRGIPKEALSHLTEAFYRVDKSRAREFGGAGLGLTLCSKIVALHKGTMEFESLVGKGTRVRVVLKGGAA